MHRRLPLGAVPSPVCVGVGDMAEAGAALTAVYRSFAELMAIRAGIGMDTSPIPGKGDAVSTANMTTGQQLFTLYPTNPQFAHSEDIPLWYGLYAQSSVNLSNGQKIIVQNGIPQDDPWN